MLASPDAGQTFDTLLASMSAEDLEEIAGLMAEAIRYSESGRARRKIIIRVSD